MKHTQPASYMFVKSPIGTLSLLEQGGALTALSFGREAFPGSEEETPLLKQARQELSDYFAGTRKTFSIPLRAEGTDFQRKVWAALQHIPYGETCTYGDIARAIGSPKACRAVGMANHRNPLSIFIPCHRVVGQNGTLTGYGGGLPVKEFLLALEKEHL